jgi:pSer/pThr/pTyr-binding forkhead associated (FHA) protein
MEENQQEEPVAPEGNPADETSLIPEEAFIIMDGVKVIPLTQPIINLGRRIENTLVFEDERVSRFHAQIRAINGRYVLFDLDSTTGTFINGKRTTQSILYPGDVISLGGVNLVYGQENPPPRPDLKETAPF